MEDEEPAAGETALQDRLLNGVRALEHLLTLNIMPGDFEMEDIAYASAAFEPAVPRLRVS